MTQREQTPMGTGGRALLERMRAAVKAQREGRLELAIEEYRAVLRSHPRFAEAHNNLAVALKAKGRLDEAIESFRRALEARPGYAAAHTNLAAALSLAGRPADALHHAIGAARHEPANLGNRRILAETLRPMRFTAASPEVIGAVTACFEGEGIEHQLIAAAALSLLRLDPTISKALEVSQVGGAAPLARSLRRGELRPLFENTLLHRVLSKTLVAAPDFERLLGQLRGCFLDSALAERGEDRLAGLFHDDPALLAALAEQCFLNGYLYPRAEGTRQHLDDLRRRVDTGPTDTAEVCLLAMFEPLHGFEGAARLAAWSEAAAAPVKALVRRQILEPEAERVLARDLPALTPVTDQVSRAVRRQYEANPYPRWITTGHKTPRPLRQVVAELFPLAGDLRLDREAPRILVAGCGTGKHAIDVALRYRAAEILAVDLSRASLAYARRKAGELGLDRIRFAQADILRLEAPDRGFDLIESVGVLHHLRDPLEGWRRLRGLLTRGGLMKIGLYSAKARRSIDAARTLLRECGFSSRGDDIRAARRTILELPSDHPAAAVVLELDFYSLNGCRDLLFNVQESAVSIPDIARWLESLELAFLGFEIVERTTHLAYKARYPEDPAMTDLRLWDRFEAARPDTFRTMYQFWCRAP